jgi:membrane protease subunit HflK
MTAAMEPPSYQSNAPRGGRSDLPDELVQLLAFVARYRRPLGLGAAVLLSLSTLAATFYTVQPSEEVVITRFGKYERTTGPGLHFKLPFGIETAITVRSKLILQDEFGFRSMDVDARGSTTYQSNTFDKESQMLTGDLNVADVEWIVQYQIADPKKFLFHAQNPHQNIRDVSEAIMRRVVGDRTVNEVLTTGRVSIGITAQRLVQEVLDKYDLGIRIVTVKLQDVNPPEVVKPSFNEVNAAKQEQEQAINVAEEAYNKVIPEARGKAEETVSHAEGFASAVVNHARGDAERFNLTLRQYKLAPEITRKRMYLEAMEDLYSRFKTLTIVDEKVRGIMPVFGGQNLGTDGASAAKGTR